MGRRNRECYLCGKDYLYCPTCSQDKMKPAWMAEFHSESCKNIFDICTRFNMGMMSKTEAKEALKTCDLSNKVNFKSYVQHDLEVIFAEEPKKKTKKVEAPIIEEPIKALETHEVVEKENE